MNKKIQGLIVHNRDRVVQDFNQERNFLNNVYFDKVQDINIVQNESIEKEKWEEFYRILDQLGDQTNKLKSIIENASPAKENDMPILKYDDISEYIIHGFDANENMSVIEVFTDKWERYTKERSSKDLYKEWLREEYHYHSNRLPQYLTSKFKSVVDTEGVERIKAYLTVFIPKLKIQCVLNNQRYQDSVETEIDYNKLVVFGILSPQCFGCIPELRFYTNNSRSSWRIWIHY